MVCRRNISVHKLHKGDTDDDYYDDDKYTMMMMMMIKRTFGLVDFVIPSDRDVIKKDAEKILKFKDLIIGIQRMWNVKVKVMPVITGATGTIAESLRQYLSNTAGKHEINPYPSNVVNIVSS
jgi:hypothetical protein